MTKNYDINSWATIGLKGEKVLAFLNHIQISVVGGGFGAVLNADNIGKSTTNSFYASGTGGPSWFGFGGLKLALNLGPRIQVYVQDIYTALISDKWDISYYGGGAQSSNLASQLKGNLDFKANSINFGIRIR